MKWLSSTNKSVDRGEGTKRLVLCGSLLLLVKPTTSEFVLGLVEKYLFKDWDFVGFLAVLVFVDTVTGILYALKTKEFNSHRMGDIVYKIILYPLALITVNAISNHTVSGQANFIIKAIVPYFNAVAYFFFVSREALSIAENMGKMGFRILPKFVMARFAEFDENGSFTPRKVEVKSEEKPVE